MTPNTNHFKQNPCFGKGWKRARKGFGKGSERIGKGSETYISALKVRHILLHGDKRKGSERFPTAICDQYVITNFYVLS